MELPAAFCEEMRRILGDEYPAYIRSMERERRYGLRVNTGRISVEEFERIAPFPVKRIPYIANGFFYEGDVQPAKHPYYFAGLYYLQEPSAMTPASRLPVEEGDVVLDLCAAPGGKATELASKLRGTGLLIANDISRKRARALLKNIELCGVENSFVVTEYPQKLREHFAGFFDKILIDAPCSGEGMFRKSSSMIRAWQQNGPEFYAGLQEEILSQALPMLKPGGMLLYSTCTFSPLENEGTVDKILAMDRDMELLSIEPYEGFSEGRPELIGSGDESLRRCVRIFPHRMEGEGHFLALFQKRGEKGTAPMRAQTDAVGDAAGGISGNGLGGAEKKLWRKFTDSLNREFEDARLESRNGMVYYMPSALPPVRGLRFLRSGLFLGEMKKNRFEPSQSLAMALRKEDFREVLDLPLSDERVLRYLKGETLSLSRAEAEGENGWRLVCVDGHTLGWGKKTGAVLKNKYHSGWRMR